MSRLVERQHVEDTRRQIDDAHDVVIHRGPLLEVFFPAANTRRDIPHRLGVIPSGHITVLESSGLVYAVDVHLWTPELAYLAADRPSVHWRGYFVTTGTPLAERVDDARVSSSGGGGGNGGGGGAAPAAHHISHEAGGYDLVVVTEPMIQLADVTDDNVTTGRHGFAPKLPGTLTTFFRGDGTYAAIPSAPPLPHRLTHEPGGADPLTVDAAPTVGSLRTLGSGPQQAAPGNAPRTPTAHHTTHEPGGADPMAVDAAATIGSLRTLGAGPNQAAPGNAPRPPTAHAPTHAAAGADPVGVTTLAGYPGGTATFLRADGAFATPPGIAALEYRGAYAAGTYNDGDIVIGADGVAYLCVKNGITTPPEAWPLATNPPPHHATHEPGGADALVNAAWVNVANVFTKDQRIAHNAPFPSLILDDIAQPANQRIFRVVNAVQGLYLQAVNDAMDTAAGQVSITRAGNLTASGTITERARAVPMGEWTTIPFNAANFVGAGGGTWTVDAAAVSMNRYALIGKVLLWHICIALNGGTSSITGAVSECRFTLPAGLTTYTGYLNINPVAYLADAGGAIAGGIAIGTGSFAAFKKLSGNFSGTVIAVATMMWEIL